MKTILQIILLVAIMSTGCSSDSDFDKGKKQLEQQGYTNVQNTGYNFFCCGQDDTFSTGFTCLDSEGKTVIGCFCSCVGKGITIRFE